MANVVHEGKAGEGTYRIHVHRRSEGVWYEVQDLQVTEVLPQVVALSEAYLQVYERQDSAAAGAGDTQQLAQRPAGASAPPKAA